MIVILSSSFSFRIVSAIELCLNSTKLGKISLSPTTFTWFLRQSKGSRHKKKSKCKLFPKRGGVDPKVSIFEILNFGKFQVSKWASGMKRLFKVSFKNWKKVFLVEKKNWQKWFRKKFTFRGGRGGSKANLEKVYILNFFFFNDGFPKSIREEEV